MVHKQLVLNVPVLKHWYIIFLFVFLEKHKKKLNFKYHTHWFVYKTFLSFIKKKYLFKWKIHVFGQVKTITTRIFIRIQYFLIDIYAVAKIKSHSSFCNQNQSILYVVLQINIKMNSWQEMSLIYCGNLWGFIQIKMPIISKYYESRIKKPLPATKKEIIYESVVTVGGNKWNRNCC